MSSKTVKDAQVVSRTVVVLGVDPAKRSHAMAVLDGREQVLAQLQVPNSNDGYRELLRLARRWKHRTWAVEGAGGVGAQLAQRLVADGETVVDVSPKLSTRARMFDRGHGRKTDPGDARTVAVVAIRTAGLTQVQPDGELVALRLLAERRQELVRTRTQTVNRLHQLLSELIPAGAQKNLSATRAKAMLGTVRPRDVAGRTRRALAVDLVDDLSGLDRKLKALDKQLAEAVAATGTTLLDVVGVGVVTAATILGESGDIRRFPSKHHYASYTGTAPIDNSSGDVVRHRLSRAGNRRLNHTLHIVALAHKRHDPAGAAYYAKKLAAGKGSKGALRCLKRRLADRVFRALVDDLEAVQRDAQQQTLMTGPGEHPGATTKSSAADRSPKASTSDKSLPEPASPEATPVTELSLAPS